MFKIQDVPSYSSREAIDLNPVTDGVHTEMKGYYSRSLNFRRNSSVVLSISSSK
jgi:hypothetical protein